MRQAHLVWRNFQPENCRSKFSSFFHLALGQASLDGQGSNREYILFSVPSYNSSFSVVLSGFIGYLLCQTWRWGQRGDEWDMNSSLKNCLSLAQNTTPLDIVNQAVL